MTKTIHGKIRGRMIELDEDLGVAEGQEAHPPSAPASAHFLQSRDLIASR
jgi:hypothetical protein